MKYDIRQSPGPLIRRTHQIGLSIFAECFKDLDITPLQFSIMWTLNLHPGLDQSTLAKSVALDTATCSNIVTRLETKGYIQRKINPENKRAKLASLSRKGKQLLSRAEAPMDYVQKKLIAPLDAKEKKQFLKCLQKLVDASNELSRAPMQYMPLK